MKFTSKDIEGLKQLHFEEIIDCDGKYSVHPMPGGSSWAVVNDEAGQEYCEQSSRRDAILIAEDLNKTT